jgi:hypothetical protein
MIEPSFRKILTDAPAVRALVADRVYLGADQQNERRARIGIKLDDRDNPHCFDGPAGYATGVMNVACLAPTYAAAKTLTDAARTALDGYEGFGVTPYIEIDYIEVESEADIESVPLEGQSQPTFGVALSCAFMFTDDSNN